MPVPTVKAMRSGSNANIKQINTVAKMRLAFKKVFIIQVLKNTLE